LSASTDSETIIEDPTYNPATAPVENTTPVAVDTIQPEPEVDNNVTTYEDGTTLTDEEITRNSLIGILVVIVFIGSCCFGVGALIICTL